MINKKEKGFTLVELLAVIVILAIILVIAVPKVMSIIEDAKKGTLESTAKMIASQAEKQKVQNTVLGKTEEITCDSVAKINKGDYTNCSIEFIDNIAKVTIEGKGKFDGLYVCDGTKTDAEAINEACNARYPVLMPGEAFHIIFTNINKKNQIKEINFLDNYNETEYDQKIDVSNKQDGSIFAYVNLDSDSNAIVNIVGNDSGGILLNKDLTEMFYIYGGFFSINGTEILDWSNVNETKDMVGMSYITGDLFSNIVNVTKNNSNYTLSDGVLYTKDMKKLIAYPNSKTDDSFVVPETVTIIGEDAFAYNQNLKNIEMPNVITIESGAFQGSMIENAKMPNVKTIGARAFKSNEELTSVEMPKVETIGNYAFHVTSLIEVDLPSVKKIDTGAFLCSFLTSVKMPNVIEIGDDAFNTCPSISDRLEYVEMPKVETIGENAFYKQKLNIDLDLPNVISIGREAFYDTKIKNLNIGEKVSNLKAAFAPLSVVNIHTNNNNFTIEDNILYTKDMKKLVFYEGESSNFVVPESVIAIEDYAFRYTSMSEVEMPKVETIGDYAFYQNRSLSSVEMPNVKTIGTGAFKSNEKLTSVEMPKVESVSIKSFDDMENIYVQTDDSNLIWVDGVLYNKDMKKLYLYSESKTDESYVVPNGVTEINLSAFERNGSLKSIEIPSSVAIINGLGNTYGSNTLTNMVVDTNNPKYTSLDGVLYSKDMKKLLLYPMGKTDENINIPEGVETIENYAFTNINLKIPKSVNTIKSVLLSSSLYYQGTIVDWLNVAINKEPTPQYFYVTTPIYFNSIN